MDVNGDTMVSGIQQAWARLTKLSLTISLNCIGMNRRLLVNNDFIPPSLLGNLTIS